MAGIENLRVPSSEEARAMGKKGGEASGRARRERKALKEQLLLLLQDEEVQNNIAVALVREATNGNSAGSVVRAFECIRDTIGEKPADKIELTQLSQDAIADIEAVFNDTETSSN